MSATSTVHQFPAAKRGLGRPRKLPETPEQKFYRIASHRVNEAVHKIALLGNLASRAYRYKQQDAEAIRQRLQQQLDETIGKLRHTKQVGFTFH